MDRFGSRQIGSIDRGSFFVLLLGLLFLCLFAAEWAETLLSPLELYSVREVILADALSLALVIPRRGKLDMLSDHLLPVDFDAQRSSLCVV